PRKPLRLAACPKRTPRTVSPCSMLAFRGCAVRKSETLERTPADLGCVPDRAGWKHWNVKRVLILSGPIKKREMRRIRGFFPNVVAPPPKCEREPSLRLPLPPWLALKSSCEARNCVFSGSQPSRWLGVATGSAEPANSGENSSSSALLISLE